MNGHIKDPYENNRNLKALREFLDNYDEPVKKNVIASNKKMVQAVSNFMPWIDLSYLATEFDLTYNFDFMSIVTLPMLWWATSILLFFGPYDALLSTILSGFKDSMSDYATASFEAMLWGLWLSFYQPWQTVSSIYVLPYNLTLLLFDFFFYLFVLILL